MNKPAVTQAQMVRMKRAILRDGLSFAGYLCRPDGSVMAVVGEPPVLTEAPAAAPSSDPLDTELTEWAAKHGYG